MSTGRAAVVLRVLLCTGGVIVAFAVLNEAFRALEARLAADLVRLVSPNGVHPGSGTSVLVLPHGEFPFRATVTARCSALSSLLVLGAMAWLSPRGLGPRRSLALLVSLVAVAAANILRLAACLMIGIHWGRPSLFLFRDRVGSLVTLALTLCGYILMLSLLLGPPKEGTA